MIILPSVLIYCLGRSDRSSPHPQLCQWMDRFATKGKLDCLIKTWLTVIVNCFLFRDKCDYIFLYTQINIRVYTHVHTYVQTSICVAVHSITFTLLHFTPLYITLCYITLCAGERSRYSDSLRAGRSGDRILVRARFSAPVQTGPGGQPSLLYGGYRVSFPGLKQPVRGVDHPPSYTSTPPLSLHVLLEGEIYLVLTIHATHCPIVFQEGLGNSTGDIDQNSRCSGR
jgi:hypothetical protein